MRRQHGLDLGAEFFTACCVRFVGKPEHGDTVGDLDPVATREPGARSLGEGGKKCVAPDASEVDECGNCPARGRRC
jgi:hypothetical protein